MADTAKGLERGRVVLASEGVSDSKRKPRKKRSSFSYKELYEAAVERVAQGRFGAHIGGGMGQGLLSGGGQVSYDVPVSDRLTVSPYVTGGGAYGTVDTPDGKLKIKAAGLGEAGLRLNYRF